MDPANRCSASNVWTASKGIAINVPSVAQNPFSSSSVRKSNLNSAVPSIRSNVGKPSHLSINFTTIMTTVSSLLLTGKIDRRTSANFAVKKDIISFSWMKMIWWDFIVEIITLSPWILSALFAKIKVYVGHYVQNAAPKKTMFFTVQHAESLLAPKRLAYTLILSDKLWLILSLFTVIFVGYQLSCSVQKSTTIVSVTLTFVRFAM